MIGASTMPSVPQRVAEFLTAQRGFDFCDDCIASPLGLARRQQAQQATSALGASATFRRGDGTCSNCGRDKIVIRA
jgi:hypothetical protein